MANQQLKAFKGKVARLTRLDVCGNPVFGAAGSLVSNGWIQAVLGRNEEAGQEYVQKNAWGEFIMNERDPDRLKWLTASLQFGLFDPAVMDLVAGQTPVVVGGDTIGAVDMGVPNSDAFALELWLGAAGQSCVAGQPKWGYSVIPFLKNGKVSGDVTISQAPFNMTMTAEGYAASEAWGLTPYNDNPLLATAGFPANGYSGMVITTVQPPAPTNGLVALPDPGAVEPGDSFPNNIQITAQSDAEGLTMDELGYLPADSPSWTTGEFFTLGPWSYWWNGTVWKAGVAT